MNGKLVRARSPSVSRGQAEGPGDRVQKRVLPPLAMFLWGFQFSFLNPALAFLLVELFGATAAQVGGILAVYNISGLVGSLVVARIADRRSDYLRWVVVSGISALALAVVLFSTASLTVVVLALALLGGPAAGGVPLLFAQLRKAGGRPADVVRARALFSLAWVGGPPLATFLIAAFGARAELGAILVIASLNVLTALLMLRSERRPAATSGDRAGEDLEEEFEALGRAKIAVIVLAFVVLQASNSAAVTSMALFTTRSLGLGVEWAGITLGVSAGLEIPALLLVARLTERFPALALVVQGCVVGAVYFTCMGFFVTGPILLVALQALNAWFFASLEGVGLSLFQQIIPKPGLASSLFTNTVRLGGVLAGPIISIAGASVLGYRGVFAASGVLTVIGVTLVIAVALWTRRTRALAPVS